ncbi:hypothetical protein FDA94_01645 [Herbidospora galbida]|uniref:Uncharacterized protein n=1 Tax=Herbidospora galbida TaxID=2575442 RepID=A0A4U3MPH2_9ACTN|nr:hypothetical protein [Herbidospora galbida]TKK91511.1 hypothetical protein FDA94_01645 [Herbidospora galbida]
MGRPAHPRILARDAAALGWGVSSEGPGVTNLEPGGFASPNPGGRVRVRGCLPENDDPVE